MIFGLLIVIIYVINNISELNIQFLGASDLSEDNREPGEIPGRSRHCMRRASFITTGFIREGERKQRPASQETCLILVVYAFRGKRDMTVALVL
ncbi:hypothetical protein DesLBE_0837 [Desulfitobacterium sp. LBE]|uniref:Uncharacterized protein n=2 Tax=root TaxID=1 RepID=A0A098AXX1_DESHA|nr:hypothetical protein DesLBE_0837 [Desulfitobacterium sp. LBE]CDX01459.1 Hypothetical protein DPCES_1572 [Desulfitobacterium hafniense]